MLTRFENEKYRMGKTKTMRNDKVKANLIVRTFRHCAKRGILKTYQGFAVDGEQNEAQSLTQQRHTDKPGGNRAINTTHYANEARGDAQCIFLFPYTRGRGRERDIVILLRTASGEL